MSVRIAIPPDATDFTPRSPDLVDLWTLRGPSADVVCSIQVIAYQMNSYEEEYRRYEIRFFQDGEMLRTELFKTEVELHARSLEMWGRLAKKGWRAV